MSARKLDPPLSIARWWAAKPPAAQRTLTRAAAAVAIAAALVFIAQPLARQSEGMRAALARDDAALAQARERVAEISSPARDDRTAPPGDAKADLERVLLQRSLRSSVTQLDWRDERARVVFAGVGVAPLMSALEALQRDARLRVVEAKLVTRVEPGTVRAELTLGR